MKSYLLCLIYHLFFKVTFHAYLVLMAYIKFAFVLLQLISNSQKPNKTEKRPDGPKGNKLLLTSANVFF